jgi:hypothetical protein
MTMRIDEERRQRILNDPDISAEVKEGFLPPAEQRRLRAERELEADLADLEREFIQAGGDAEDFARRRAAIKGDLILGRAKASAEQAKRAHGDWLRRHF